MLSFLRENEHPMSYSVTLPFYARNVDVEWSCEMWRQTENRNVHHIECGFIMTVLPCMGYIVMGDELFATFHQSIRNMLPSQRGTATTVWQVMMNQNNVQGTCNLKLKNMDGENMYALQCNESQIIWIERIRFVYDVCNGFSRVQRFLIRKAICNKLKSNHFTKLAAFIHMVTCSKNKHWRAIQDTGILSEIVLAYLGLLDNNSILQLRSEKRIKAKGSMKFG